MQAASPPSPAAIQGDVGSLTAAAIQGQAPAMVGAPDATMGRHLARRLNHLIAVAAESSNLTSIPSHYAYTTSASSDQSVHDDSIPVIDFSLLSSSNPDQHSKAVSNLAKTFEDWGFFMVPAVLTLPPPNFGEATFVGRAPPTNKNGGHASSLLALCLTLLLSLLPGGRDPHGLAYLINHGVPESQMKAPVEALSGFFNLIEEEKSEFEGKHVLDPIRYGTSFKVTVDKVFLWRDFLKTTVHPKFHCPTKPEGLSKVLAEYSGGLRKLVRELLKELAMGLPSHSDYGLLTILMQNGVGGLEVYHDGKWVKADLFPNAFVVNTADQLEIMSNGKYNSVLHRAIVNNKAARLSIPFSTGPSPDTVVVPVKQLVDGEHNQAAYISMNYKDYLEFKQSKVIDGKSYLNQVKI
ncbi:hypothetical protein NL676_039180 [Syzygium grande]|nr:hypothetical protein NL676_039180 [Syzygium grande]